jgi:ketosteroid isomerase-like protein
MSEENDLKTLRGIYEHWARGEFWDVSAYDPEIEYVITRDLPEPGTYHGYEGMERGFRSSWLDSWRNLRIEAEEFRAASEGRIVVLIRQTGIGKTSGVKVEAHGAMVWTFRGGKVVRLAIHENREEALQAAGLRE